MRGMTRAMMWSLVALICFISRPAAGGPQSASGIQVDKSSIGGVVVNSNGPARSPALVPSAFGAAVIKFPSRARMRT